MGIYVPYEEQQAQDADLTLKSMGIQLGINLGIAILVVTTFCFLRPRHTLVYAPKAKFAYKEHRPPPIGTGWFAWLKPVITTTDDFLIDRIGLDAVLFLRFLRLLRLLLIIMSVVGVFGLIPVNIVATYYTGEWPPSPGIDVLSISGINDRSADSKKPTDMRWYWSPAGATWLFSIIIAGFMYRASSDYINVRQHFFRHPTNAVSARSLLVTNIPKESQSNEGLETWSESMKKYTGHSIEEAMIGHHSEKLTELTEEHAKIVRELEDTLSSYLKDGKKMGKKKDKKRPKIRDGGFVCIGGRKMDAVDYLTKKANELEEEIQKLRNKKSSKSTNYGWVSYKKIIWAHEAQQALRARERLVKKSTKANEFISRLSPNPKELIWKNLALDDKARAKKRWIGRGLYWVILFAWAVPVTALSATSNVTSLIRLFPNSQDFLKNKALVGLIQAWFTPIVMALFFFVLPYILRFLSRQQGYISEATIERKVFTKLYIFFIINNLLVFTLGSVFITIYSELRSLVESGTISDDESLLKSIIQLAKNITDVSSFWINYVCIKALAVTIEMAQLIPLVIITVRKFVTRPSPRKLKEVAQPPEFDYPQHYNLILFFFTIALIYSVISPLVLPFALLYFGISTIVYKYVLMYICVTKNESGGKMWPTIFQTVMVSLLLFQAVMIIVLNLKGAHFQSYVLIPLPFLTILFQIMCYRRMKKLGSYIIGSWDPSKVNAWFESKADEEAETSSDTSEKPGEGRKHGLENQFEDPAMKAKLLQPMVHEDVKHLLPQVYHGKSESIHEPSEMELRNIDRNTRRLTILEMDDGQVFKFHTVTEAEAIDDMDDPDALDRKIVTTQVRVSRNLAMADDVDNMSQRGLVSDNRMQYIWQQRRDEREMGSLRRKPSSSRGPRDRDQTLYRQASSQRSRRMDRGEPTLHRNESPLQRNESTLQRSGSRLQRNESTLRRNGSRLHRNESQVHRDDPWMSPRYKSRRRVSDEFSIESIPDDDHYARRLKRTSSLPDMKLAGAWIGSSSRRRSPPPPERDIYIPQIVTRPRRASDASSIPHSPYRTAHYDAYLDSDNEYGAGPSGYPVHRSRSANTPRRNIYDCSSSSLELASRGHDNNVSYYDRYYYNHSASKRG